MDSAFVLLDISKKDIEEDYSTSTKLTREDREIFFTDAEIQKRDIDDFISIDEFMDYSYSKLNSSNKFKESKRDLLKICAEFMCLEISKYDMHSVSVKKDRNSVADSLKNIKLNNAKFIVNRKDNGSVSDREGITAAFATKAYVRELKKYALYPANKKIWSNSCKNNYIEPMDKKNIFSLEIQNIIDNKVVDRKYITPGRHQTVKDIVSRVINYYRYVDKFSAVDVVSETNGLYEFVETSNGVDMNNKLLFLKCKPAGGKTNTQLLYYSFDIDNKIHLLEKIMHKGLDDSENTSILNKLLVEKKNSVDYQNKINILISQSAKNSRLEQLCKKRYPNYFNPAKKEFTFSKASIFNLENLPVAIQNSLLTEYNLVESLESKLAANKCKHKGDLHILRNSNMNKEIWNQFKENYMNGNVDKKYLNCSLCSYPLMCPHEIDYYDMFFKMAREDSINYIDRINQIITTKYGLERSKTNSSICSVCGMEINKMLDTDGMNYNESENMYKGDSGNSYTISDDKRTILYVINRNLSFSKPVSRTVINGVISGIYESVNPVISVINKKINNGRKGIKNKEKAEEMATNKEINMTILTIVCIMTLSIKYDFIQFKPSVDSRSVNAKSSNIIIKRSKGISDRFREAWDIFYSRYKNLIDKLGRGQNIIDQLKKLFVKSYDLLKETIGESVFISEGNISSHTTPSVVEEYDDKTVNRSKKTGIELEYKKKSDVLFKKYLDENVSSTYVSERQHNPAWKEFKLQSEKLRELERIIIQKNLLGMLYPYSRINYSYERYYKKDLDNWSNDMTLFACPSNGKRHVWDMYTFKNKDKLESFKIKTISSKDTDLQFIKNASIYSFRCSNCGLDTEELKSKFDSKTYSTTVEDRVKKLNNIQSFYSIYKYRCVKSEFHSFRANKDGNYECSTCGMLFSYSSSLDEKFYNKYKSNYDKFIKEIETSKNGEILKHKQANTLLESMDTNTGFYSTKENKEITKLTVLETIEKIYKPGDGKILNHIHTMGSTENLEEVDIYNVKEFKPHSTKISEDIFSKLLDRLRQIIIYMGILIKTPYKHKYSTDTDFLDIANSINQSNKSKEILEELSIIYNYTINHRLLDSVLAYKANHTDGTAGAIEYIKLIILHILSHLKTSKHNDGSVYRFIIDKIIDSELIYTKYNYAELKKTYNMNKLTEDNINLSGLDIDSEIGNEEEDIKESESFELFEMADLSMNNFVDDDIE